MTAPAPVRYPTVAPCPADRDVAARGFGMMQPPLLARLDVRDRALFLRWVIGEHTSERVTRAWRLMTHVGGARVTILAVLVPMFLATGTARLAAFQAAWALALSHLVVQIIKRKVLRERPSVRITTATHVEVPDRFSFPSGHSCAVMSVAFIFAFQFPAFSLPLLLLSSLVGWSRVRLGVHYPGDVLAGQVIAVATGIVVLGLW